MNILISKKKYDRLLEKYNSEVPELTLDQLAENGRAYRECMNYGWVSHFNPPHDKKKFETWLSEELNVPLNTLDNITIRI